jgi:16S rRNA (guanine966-N2)-methyltransferase
MRVIAGTARGRKLLAPAGRGTRPITDRAKEGIFNMLASLGGVGDAVVADLYAGSGSFGIECLSRGARQVTFVERARPAVATIRANLDRLGFAGRSVVVSGPVETAIEALGPLDLAFCDPPYADDPWSQLLPGLDAGLLVAHAETPVDLPPAWVALRRRRYGRAHIVIAAPAERPSPGQISQL